MANQTQHGDHNIKKEPTKWGFFAPRDGGLHERAVPQYPPKKQQKRMRIIRNFTDGIHQFLLQSLKVSNDSDVCERFTKFTLLHGPDRALRALLRQDTLWTEGDVADMEELHFWSEDQNMDEAMQVLRFDYIEKVKPVVERLDITDLFGLAGDGKTPGAVHPSGEGEDADSISGDFDFAGYSSANGQTVKQFFQKLRMNLGMEAGPLSKKAVGETKQNPLLYPSLQGLGDGIDGPVVPQPKGILKPKPTPGPIGTADDYRIPGACGLSPPSKPGAQSGDEKMVYEIRYIAPGEWEYTGRIIPSSKQKTEPTFTPNQNPVKKTSNKTDYEPKQPILSHLGKIAGTKVTKQEEVSEPAIYKAVDAVARSMENSNIPQDSPFSALTLVMTAAVIEGIKTAKEEKRKAKEEAMKSKEAKTEILKPTLDDLSVESFDYNITGTEPAGILGPRFRDTVFKNEETRISVMRGILQRVIDDPLTSTKTREEALRVMGKCDIPRLYEQMGQRASISVLEAMAKPVSMPETRYPRGHDSDSSDEDDDEEKDLISPPELGSVATFGPNLVKSLRASLGITEQDKYDVDKDGKSLKYYLPMLKSQITANKLNRECAFSLFLSVLGGDSEQDVRNRLGSGESFEHVWMHMQKMASERLSPEGAFREIQKICKDKPTNPEAAFTKIRNLRLRMYAHIKKPAIRKAQFERTVQEDMIRMMTLHYGMLYPLVMAQFKAKKDAHKITKKLKKQQGVPKEQIEDFNDVDVMMETICTNIKKTAGSMDGSGPKQVYIDEVTAGYHSPSSGPAPSSSGSTKSSQKNKKPGQQGQGGNQNQASQQMMMQQPMQQQQQMVPMQQAGMWQQQQQQPQNQQMQPQMQQQSKPMVTTSGQTKQLFEPYPDRSQEERERLARCIQALGPNRCILCGRSNHFARLCRVYQGQRASDHQCKHCEGFHEGNCQKLIYQDKLARGEIQPRNNNNNRNQQRNGGNGAYRRGGFNNQQQPQTQYVQMQQQPIQYVDANGQPIQVVHQQQPVVQQAAAGSFYQVPQPQAMQMMVPSNQMVSNNKAGAILGNGGVQTVPENAYMNTVSVAQPQQLQQMQQMQQVQMAPVSVSTTSPVTRAYTNTAPINQ